MTIEYEILDSEEELRMVEGQLGNLEREHYNMSVVLPSSDLLTVPERIIFVEGEILRLRAVRDALIAATAATPS